MVLFFKAPELLTDLPSSQRFAAIGGIYVLLAVWLRVVVSRPPPGLLRLLLASPILAAGILSAWIFDMKTEILPRTSCLFVLSWLCTFKVRVYVVGGGRGGTGCVRCAWRQGRAGLIMQQLLD